MSVPNENSTKSSTETQRDKTTWNRIRSWIAIALAIVAVILALTLRGCSSLPAGPTAGSQCSLTPSPGPAGLAGLSAYELWLKVGNKGTEQDFQKSLIGTPGKDGYIGSNGFTGASGTTGDSAYQIWLDSGHSGTPQEFLDSLAGTSGANGLAGLSAYQLWLALGHVGTESQFLASLVGPQGVIGQTGAPGVCTVGDAGANGTPGADGVNGLSAYQVWLANGNTGGTVEQFLTSLIGDPGAQGAQGLQGAVGAQGAQGATGPAGPAGLSGLGYSASYWSTDPQPQPTANTIQAMTLNHTDWQNGITRESTSHIKIGHAGKYNIAFSAQLHQTNSSGVVNIWLAKNGVAMPDTNTKVAVTANNPYFVAAWNFFIDAGQNDYYEVMWSSTDNHTVIEYEAPVTTPAGVHPAVPSLILTVNQVG